MLFSILIAVLTVPNSQAQTEIDPLSTEIKMSTGRIEACSGAFTDSGGKSGNYSSSSNLTMTICPNQPRSEVKVEFLNFSTESNYDQLFIFDGANSQSTQIQGPGRSGGYDSVRSPGTVSSSDASGCLTFKFQSDSSVERAGWEATISCESRNPGCPALLAPVQASTVSIFQQFTWDKTRFATGYNVYLGLDPNPALFASNVRVTKLDPGELIYGATYYWKVEPLIAGFPTLNCPVQSFFVGHF